jgi:phosphomannomutase
MKALTRKYSDGQYDDLDGVTIQFKDWWFNVRPSNTEPLLRLNVEAKTADLLDEKLTELEDFLGEPVDH